VTTAGRTEHVAAPLRRFLIRLLVHSAVASGKSVAEYTSSAVACWPGDDPEGLLGFLSLAGAAAEAVGASPGMAA